MGRSTGWRCEGVLEGDGKEYRKVMGRSIGLIKKITCEGIRVILRSRISNILRFTDSKFRKERERGEEGGRYQSQYYYEVSCLILFV